LEHFRANEGPEALPEASPQPTTDEKKAVIPEKLLRAFSTREIGNLAQEG